MPPNGNAGDEHVLELLERIRHAEVLLERRRAPSRPAPAASRLRLRARARRAPRSRVARPAPATFFHGPAANAKRYVGSGSVSRKWIRRQTVALLSTRSVIAVRDRDPARRHREREREARLEIGLVEAGKEQVRVRRDEQRVEIVGAVLVVVEADDARAGRRDRRREVGRRRMFSPARIADAGMRRCAPLNVVAAAAPFTVTFVRLGPRKSRMTSADRFAVKRTTIEPRAVSRA